MKTLPKFTHVALIVLSTLVFTACACFAVSEQSHGYTNTRQGYSLMLPRELQFAFEKQNDPEWAARNLMPFDYVNFRPAPERAAQLEPLELGIGVHPNRKKLSCRVFADSKDAGVRASVKQYVTRRASEVVVAGRTGVRDDFALEKSFGWISYSRVIIPAGDTFIVFLFTSGWDQPDPASERMFQQMLDSFKLEQ